MAGRGRNPGLQGAYPALVQILQEMQNRDANRDNSQRQFLMFPKVAFTGEDKKQAKSHWAEFSKYLDYQNQQGTLPRDLAHLPQIKSMFKLTLQDIALGWFETESPNWATENQMRTLNVFYQGTNVEMLEETYLKFKKNILPKMKKQEPDFQEPVVEYCELEQVIDICSYNHYPILDKCNTTQERQNDDNDIYDTSKLEHEFEYGIYEDVFKTEQLMAELKRIDEAKKENKKLRDVQFEDFPLEQFSDAGRIANEGDPHLKAAADIELYDLEKHCYTNGKT